ncbi:hypothetical protein AAVH_36364 [Aphelenchoides avenae]|nr:hypothetical protein AAVH_36364 [Aphelenchus avenae]
MTSDEKRTTSNTQFIAGIAKWQPEVNGINNFVHPLETLSSMDFEKIKYYQDFMLSAAARAHEQKVSEMKRAAHTGKLSPLENGEVQFVTERCYNEEEWAIRTKLWKEEAIVVISPTEGEGAFQPVGIAQLTAVEVDEDERTFSVTLRAEPLKAGERDIKPESVLGCIIRGQLEAKVSFSESNTQFKSLMDVHNDNKIASAFRHGYPVQYLLSVMLGISHLLPPPQLKNAVLQTNNDDLNPEQLESLLCTLRRQPLTFTGASAGTGKTLVLGRLGREWYLLHEGVLLIVAPSNNASTNCTEAFVKCTNPAADEFLVIQSNAFNRSAAGQLPVSFTESRLLATTKRVYDEQKESMEEAEKLAIEDYISRSEDGMSFHVPDDKALTFVLKHRKPRIIFCTLGMLHKCKGKLEPFITGVAIDEAAVLTEQELTTAMAMLRNVETVSFVGDPKQSKSHDFDVPDGVRSYGLFPVTDVVEARGIPKIDLRYTYRFGKLFLERLVSPACYDDLLKCGADDTLHRRFFDLKFHGVSPQVPAIIFNTDARDVRNLAKSRHNEQQRSGALRMAKSILKQQPDACIAILTYYAAEAGACQHELVRRGLKEIETFTVDKYQGRECDYALVLLSRAHNEAEEFEASKFKFILDPNRATVSVTRCRQGLFVFGQVSLLRRNDVWNKFLTALEQHSPILQLESLDDLIDNAE